MSARGTQWIANVILILSVAGALPSHPPNAKRAANAVPVQTTICEIARRPRYFNHKLVHFRARVESDGIEHTALLDKACPMTGIEPSFPPSITGDPGVRELHEAIFAHGAAGTRGKLITATFTGVFRWHKGRIPSRTLTVRTVTGLRMCLEHGK